MPESLKIIENGLVVTCDAHRRVGPMALLVRNDRIAEIAPQAESFRVPYPGAEVLDASGRVVVPGFVDAHYHGESFILRHWTTSVPCGDWMHNPKTREILSHVHRELSAERLGIFYRLAHFRALRAGIKFVNEFGINNLDQTTSSPRRSTRSFWRSASRPAAGSTSRAPAISCRSISRRPGTRPSHSSWMVATQT